MGMAIIVPFVHKGEVVFNQEDVQMLGGWKNVEALRPTSKTPIQSNSNDNTIAMIEATNNRIDMITVIADSEGILDAAMNKKIESFSRLHHARGNSTFCVHSRAPEPSGLLLSNRRNLPCLFRDYLDSLANLARVLKLA